MMPPIKNRKDRLATELSLIEAARELFAEKGYENSTTKEIATLAACNEALIQRYFEGKEGLLLAVLQAGIKQQNASSLKGLPYHHELFDEILQMCKHLRDCMHESSDEIKIAFSRLLLDSEFYKKFLQISMSNDYQTVMEKRLLRYKDLGMIAPNHDLAAIVDVLANTILHMGFFKPEVFKLKEDEVSNRLNLFCLVIAKGLS